MSSNDTADQVLALAKRIEAASASIEPKEFAKHLVKNEGIDPEIAWLAWGCVLAGKKEKE